MAKRGRESDSDEDDSLTCPSGSASAEANHSESRPTRRRRNNVKSNIAKEPKLPSKASILILAHTEDIATDRNGVDSLNCGSSLWVCVTYII